MKTQLLGYFIDLVWIMGFGITVLSLVTGGFSIASFLAVRIFKQCKAWTYIVDYFVNRRRFRAWLKSEETIP